MSDGTHCHYCGRYACICDRIDKAEIVELPQDIMLWAVFLADAAMPFSVIPRADDAMVFYKANEDRFDAGFYQLRRIKVGTGLGHGYAELDKLINAHEMAYHRLIWITREFIRVEGDESKVPEMKSLLAQVEHTRAAIFDALRPILAENKDARR